MATSRGTSKKGCGIAGAMPTTENPLERLEAMEHHLDLLKEDLERLREDLQGIEK